MTRVYVAGIGLLGPGLPAWADAGAVLRGEAVLQSGEVAIPAATSLPSAERRRASAATRLAIAVGQEALHQSGHAASDLATVFAASGADGDTIHAILGVLATAEREISPTRFHNSVHNAPSGYWSLAHAAMAPSTSLCGFDGSFAIGLLDAAVQATVDARPVMLIVYDLAYPEPLAAVRPIGAAFAVALVLTPHRDDRTVASLTLALHHDGAAGTGMADASLEALRLGNPAARSLPLLAALAMGGHAEVGIERIGSACLRISVAPP